MLRRVEGQSVRLVRDASDQESKTRKQERRNMSTLVVIGYDDQFKVEEVRFFLMKMQKDEQ